MGPLIPASLERSVFFNLLGFNSNPQGSKAFLHFVDIGRRKKMSLPAE
jgi:hypothetical protein